MATERTEQIEVAIIVNRIQFERCGNKLCLCGNSHQEVAETAWIDALAEAGIDGKIEYGNDAGKTDYYITETWRDGEDGDEEEYERVWWPSCHGPNRDARKDLACATTGLEPSADVLAAWHAAEEAEYAAACAAHQAADDDCSTTDDERARDDQAWYWQEVMRRDEADAAAKAKLDALLADKPEAIKVALADLAGKSRSARKRMWRGLRATIGAAATAELQAAVTGFVKGS
jgi:hypothetical protein